MLERQRPPPPPLALRAGSSAGRGGVLGRQGRGPRPAGAGSSAGRGGVGGLGRGRGPGPGAGELGWELRLPIREGQGAVRKKVGGLGRQGRGASTQSWGLVVQIVRTFYIDVDERLQKEGATNVKNKTMAINSAGFEIFFQNLRTRP
ncbi:spidroin-1-like [Gorilla gorilla gorilla]|uniref:spidroin-1-like n=1 Tax=Gorilla gorilla gorilla TaxID=9595 RepID=UPI00300BC9B2